MPAQPQTDEFEQYARPPVSTGGDEFAQYERKPAAPTGLTATADQHNFSERIGDRIKQNIYSIPNAMDSVRHAMQGKEPTPDEKNQSDYFEDLAGKKDWQSGTLKGAATGLAKDVLLVPHMIYDAGKSWLNDPAAAAGDIATGLIGHEISAPPETKAQPTIARPTPRVEPITEQPSTMASRAGDVAKRRIGNLPGVKAVKDADFILRGPKEATAAKPVAKPAPVPETEGIRWGTGGDVPLEQRGKMIPPEPPELSSPARTIGNSREIIARPKPAEPIPARKGLRLPLPKTGEAEAVSSPSRTLPGMNSPEVVRPNIARPTAEPIPSRPGLALPPAKIAAPEVGDMLNDGLGGKPIQPSVSLKEQGLGVPKDFTPVKSTALKGYKYDAEAKEFHAMSKDGTVHIYGDVSPEEAQAFAANPSSGKAWQTIRNSSSPKVAKVVNGQRVANVPPKGLRTAAPDTPAPEPRIAKPNEDLTGVLTKSVEQAKNKKRAIAKAAQ